METLYRKGAGEPDPFLETFLRGMETVQVPGNVRHQVIRLETFLRGMETGLMQLMPKTAKGLETFLRGMETLEWVLDLQFKCNSRG